MCAGRQDAATGQADKGTGILVLEVVQGGVLAVFTGLGLVAEAVIVVDHAAVDLAGIDRLEHGTVAPVRGKVAFHPFQPLEGRGFTLECQHGGDDRLEVGAGRRSAPAALPVRTGEVHQ
ncbi:hypothetical protein D3C86_1636660 [compost metagenome]